MADKNFLRKLMEKATARPQAQRPAPILHLTAPRLLAAALVVLCAVAWAFFMGFMVGRGQSPAEEIHAMTGMLEPPAAKSPQPETTLPGQEADAQNAPASQPPQPPGLNPSGSAAIPAAAPVAAAAAATHAARPAPQRPVAQAPPRPAVQKPAPKEQQFDYTFQVSAVKSQNDAARLTKQLAGKGVKASVSKSGKVWLVIASLRGGATEVDKFNSALASLRLGKPLRLSKKPAPPPAPKRGRNK